MALVRYDVTDRVARITLCDPSGTNPINLAMSEELLAAVANARRDDVHIVVLSSEGRAFTVGGDVRAFAASDDAATVLDDVTAALHRAVLELIELDAIVVSVVQGVAAGAGVALAAAADLVVAGESAKFTLAYTRIGYSPDGGTSLLSTSVGLHRLLALALLNPVISAQEARALGLVAQVHADDALAAAVEVLVTELRAGSREAQVASKHLIRARAASDVAAALRTETLSIRARAGSPDGVEGVTAFVEKRTAAFPSSAS